MRVADLDPLLRAGDEARDAGRQRRNLDRDAIKAGGDLGELGRGQPGALSQGDGGAPVL